MLVTAAIDKLEEGRECFKAQSARGHCCRPAGREALVVFGYPHPLFFLTEEKRSEDMISVTVAANGALRHHRPSGSQLRPYGSRRIGVYALLKQRSSLEETVTGTCYWYSVLEKLLHIVNGFLHCICPAAFLRTATIQTKLCKRLSQPPHDTVPPILQLSKSATTRIFTQLSNQDLRSCELVCKSWYGFIKANNEILPKCQVDQMKMHLDEGEVLFYPIDERKSPMRFPMVSAQQLSAHLRHIQPASIFIRGLIEIETRPILQMLCDHRHLRPSQIYFLWCKFADDAHNLLRKCLHIHQESIIDIGFEDCSPAPLISDRLFLYGLILSKLHSLRIWSDEKRCERHCISDQSLIEISRQKPFIMDTLDLSNTEITAVGIVAIIEAWSKSSPTKNVTIITVGCKRVCKKDLLALCAARQLPMQARGIITVNAFTLSVFCS